MRYHTQTHRIPCHVPSSRDFYIFAVFIFLRRPKRPFRALFYFSRTKLGKQFRAHFINTGKSPLQTTILFSLSTGFNFRAPNFQIRISRVLIFAHLLLRENHGSYFRTCSLRDNITHANFARSKVISINILIIFRASSLIIYIITRSFMMLFDFIQTFRQRLVTSSVNAITVNLTSL